MEPPLVGIGDAAKSELAYLLLMELASCRLAVCKYR